MKTRTRRSRLKGEYIRQMSIAQTGINWMVTMKIDPSGTRIEDVIAAGSVADWAAKFEVR